MEVRLKKIGNSTVLIVPPSVLKHLAIGVGHTLTMTTTPDGRLILSPKPRYTLNELIAQCDTQAAPPGDLELWNVARAAGQEAPL